MDVERRPLLWSIHPQLRVSMSDAVPRDLACGLGERHEFDRCPAERGLGVRVDARVEVASENVGQTKEGGLSAAFGPLLDTAADGLGKHSESCPCPALVAFARLLPPEAMGISSELLLNSRGPLWSDSVDRHCRKCIMVRCAFWRDVDGSGLRQHVLEVLCEFWPVCTVRAPFLAEALPRTGVHMR